MVQYILMWLSFLAMVTVNVLSNTLPINGQTAADISDRLDVLFTPAGYVFSIWSVIYLVVLIWLVLQFKAMKQPEWKPVIGWLFIVSCLLNIGWLFSWHYEQFALSILLMFLLLFTLIGLYLNYEKTQTKFSQRFPFSYYLAWISVATIANTSYVLKHFSIDLGVSEVMGSLLLVAVACAIAYIAMAYSKDPYFVLVIVWALIGIVVKANEDLMMYGTLVLVIILILAALANWRFTRHTVKRS